MSWLLAGIRANQGSKRGMGKILPRHILLSVKDDAELDKLLKDVVLECGGVKPNIEKFILEKHGEEEE